jgi:nucleoside phosphorylase
MSSILRYEDYTIGWICALPIEATAAMFTLDEVHEGHFPLRPGQETLYTGGSINGRNIAIACLSKGEYGVGSAARVVSQMRLSFPNLKFGLMVGIGAGVPGPNVDIRLGDIVVSVPDGTSGGIVGYDLGKETLDGFQLKGWCNATDATLRSAISKIESTATFRGDEFIQYLEKIERDPRAKRFVRPVDQDILYHAENINEPVSRPDRPNRPQVHYGLIASGNKVIKNAVLRDTLRDLHGIICFEMEAAGLMNTLPVAVIRGVCDYADSHKNDRWHYYAAAAAAAYARGLLDEFAMESTAGSNITAVATVKPGHGKKESMSAMSGAVSTMPFFRDKKNFIGRNDLIATIEEGLHKHNRLVLVGLGGIG